MDVHTKEQRSYNMSRIRSKNTKPEKLMFKLLGEKGYKFKKHYPIAGQPDIAFPKFKIAIFIDGEFWHGKGFNKLKDHLSPFWIEKISQNIKRDKKINRVLSKKGWKVLHFWGKDLMKDPQYALNQLIKIAPL